MAICFDYGRRNPPLLSPPGGPVAALRTACGEGGAESAEQTAGGDVDVTRASFLPQT